MSACTLSPPIIEKPVQVEWLTVVILHHLCYVGTLLNPCHPDPPVLALSHYLLLHKCSRCKYAFNDGQNFSLACTHGWVIFIHEEVSNRTKIFHYRINFQITFLPLEWKLLLKYFNINLSKKICFFCLLNLLDLISSLLSIFCYSLWSLLKNALKLDVSIMCDGVYVLEKINIETQKLKAASVEILQYSTPPKRLGSMARYSRIFPFKKSFLEY